MLVGGGTGLIGDPKPTAERAMISKDEVAHNFACLKKQAQDVFGFEVVNNYDWIKDINTLDFLRDYGKYFNINYMLNKKLGKEAYGFTMPLVTKADGTKFGKSEGKAIWLDKNKTSSYELYQFLVNSEDSKVIEYLKTLTFLSREEIEDLEEKTKIDAGRREAQKALAKAVVIDLHGEEEYEKD